MTFSFFRFFFFIFAIATFSFVIANDSKNHDSSIKSTTTDQCTTESNNRIGLCGSKVKRVSRSPLEAVLLQLGIRAKYAYQQWFGWKPFLYGISSNPSPYRPTNIPK